MFQLTNKELDSFVKESGFLKNSLEKMFRLLDVLVTLKSNPVTKDAFVLKGGTALNLFILEFPRISIDIDLNYIHFVSKSDMLKERKLITSEIQKLFSSEYQIEMTKEVYALSQVAFHYQTMSSSTDTLKLDINYLIRIPLLNPKVRRFEHFGQDVEFLCLDYQEILASKIIALLSRYTPRDVFDVYQMIVSPLNVDNRILRSLLIFYSIVGDTNIFDLFNLKFELVTQNDIQNKLSPMLRRRTYPDRGELVTRIEKFLTPFLALTDKETDAIHNFYNTGQLDFDIFFPQKQIQKKIRISPSLEWKIQNIRSNL
jgi:predicted nucleotidyltransferase component of viral defense system